MSRTSAAFSSFSPVGLFNRKKEEEEAAAKNARSRWVFQKPALINLCCFTNTSHSDGSDKWTETRSTFFTTVCPLIRLYGRNLLWFIVIRTFIVLADKKALES